jgi:putative ABC transport system substrate-binding protein
MRRRELIVLLGGAMIATHALGAQQKAMPVIGWLSPGSPQTDDIPDRLGGFRQGLNEMGYVEGRNVTIEYRWAEGHYDRLPAFAADLVARKVDVIATSGGTLPARTAKSATALIPIVFETGIDPVETGLVDSFARPGGNLTGVTIITAELNPKRLELLCELVPHAGVIAMLVNPHSLFGGRMIRDVADAARTKGVQLPILKAGTENEFDVAFASLKELGAGALLVGNDPFFFSRREQLVTLAARDAIPAIYEWREFVAVGGLVSYGTSIARMYRRLGAYVGRVLAGTKPADLPVEQPTRFELVVNLKTAKELGLTVPPSILARADEVIE